MAKEQKQPLSNSNIQTLQNVVTQLSQVLGDMSPTYVSSPEFERIGLCKVGIQEILDAYKKNK